MSFRIRTESGPSSLSQLHSIASTLLNKSTSDKTPNKNVIIFDGVKWTFGYAKDGVKGDKGPKGDKGDSITGPKGDFTIGEKGQRGEKGDQGIKGDKGDFTVGEKGQRGDKGDKGDQGIKGDKGDFTVGEKGQRGDKGDRGDQGLKGDQGDKGIKGDQGLKGDQGDKGIKGDQGDKGYHGNKGDQGAKGDKGEKGYQGDKGDMGRQGDKGEKGDKGDKGDSVTGPRGDKGDMGLQGNKGYSVTGPRGYRGDSITGPRGYRGDSITGPRGDRGESVTGPKGDKGDRGESITGPHNTYRNYFSPHIGTSPYVYNIPLNMSGSFIDVDTNDTLTTTMVLPDTSMCPIGTYYTISKKPVVISTNILNIATANSLQCIIGLFYESSSSIGCNYSTTQISSHKNEQSQVTLMSDGKSWRTVGGGMGFVESEVIRVPKRVLYIDFDIEIKDGIKLLQVIQKSIESGYNDIILGFYVQTGMPTGSYNAAARWQSLDGSIQRNFIRDVVHANNATLCVGAGGNTDTSPFLANPALYAKEVCDWAMLNNLDGVNFALEHIQSGFGYTGMSADKLLSWFNTLNQTSRHILGHRILSHSIQAPYLSAVMCPNGSYLDVYRQNPSIDYIIAQFYNQSSKYTKYKNVFLSANKNIEFPNANVTDIIQNGIPHNKLIVGFALNQMCGNICQYDPFLIKTWFDDYHNSTGYKMSTCLWQFQSSKGAAPSVNVYDWINITR
jgi:hypothetical protein